MSSPSLWTDVRISAACTHTLVQELLAASAAVEAGLVLLADGAVDPGDWGGPHRLAFDRERLQLLQQGRSLAAALLATAEGAAALQAAGEGEQRLRQRVRHLVEVDLRPAGAR